MFTLSTAPSRPATPAPRGGLAGRLAGIPGRLALAALAVTLAASVAGCGGTNSETPWPVEPDDVDLGPEGEVRTNEQLAPSGSKTAPTKPKPTATPEEEPEAPKAAPRAPEPSTPSNPSTQF
jgi:hypothetical protein